MYNEYINKKGWLFVMDYINFALEFLKRYALALTNAIDIITLKAIIRVIAKDYNQTITVSSGMTRMVIITKQFVIKMDYGSNSDKWGDCEAEYNFYRFAKEEGYDYLFARVDKVTVKGKTFYIMPFIDKVGTGSDDIEDYTDCLETLWLHRHVGDLHYKNFGFNEDGMPIIIDYACIYSMEHISDEYDDEFSY